MKQELQSLIKTHGMQKLLETLIAQLNEDIVAYNESEGYIIQLRDNLQKTYDDYIHRYDNEDQ